MGHHHELPLIGVMELRPDQLRRHPEISPRDFKELRPNHIQFMFNHPICTSHAYESHANIYNQPPINFHSKTMSQFTTFIP